MSDRYQVKLFAESDLTRVRPAAIDFDLFVPGSLWRHHTGRAYRLLMVTNTDATEPLRYPVTVVYKDAHGRIWSKSVPRFLESMEHVPAAQIHDAVTDIGERVFEACRRRYSPSRIRTYYVKSGFDADAVVAQLVARENGR